MIIGLDMGGTHIDGVIIKDNRVINTIKNPTDKDDLFNSIWSTLKELLRDYDKSDIRRINLSTTISTNAIVEDKTSSVAMIIQAGPGLNSDFLACGRENSFISGYIDHRGKLVEDFNREEIDEARKLFKEKNIDSCGVVTKFSTRNPENEIRIRDMLEEEFQHISLGHRMSGKLNFPRRVFTSYLNSAVHSTFEEFSKNIKLSLKREGIDAPVFILKADGGTMDIQTAEERPVETILSGPAASFTGMNSMLETEGDSILLDIGGTTTDIFFLADGVPLFEPLGAEISEYKTLVRAVYSRSIGLGGDSSINIEDNKLQIGPRRMGKPYAFGGPSPTPTDAMIFLNLIDIEKEDHKERAGEAMEILASKLDQKPERLAEDILLEMGNIIKRKTDELLLEINSKPVYTVRELLHGKEIVPESINIIGGPAKALAAILEDKYKLDCKYPENYSVANAVGAALAKTTVEITMLADTAQGILTVSDLGVQEKIPRDFTLEDAKKRAKELLQEAVISMEGKGHTIESEITEASSFNMIGGFLTTGKNIRVKAQIKPGYILKLRSGEDYEG